MALILLDVWAHLSKLVISRKLNIFIKSSFGNSSNLIDFSLKFLSPFPSFAIVFTLHCTCLKKYKNLLKLRFWIQIFLMRFKELEPKRDFFQNQTSADKILLSIWIQFRIWNRNRNSSSWVLASIWVEMFFFGIKINKSAAHTIIAHVQKFVHVCTSQTHTWIQIRNQNRIHTQNRNQNTGSVNANWVFWISSER